MLKELLTECGNIFVVKNFASHKYCDAMIEKIEAAGFSEATINGFGGAYINKGVRNNDRVIVDEPETAALLWSSLEQFVPPKENAKAVGLNERFRYYRYEPGQYFDWHFDGPFRRNALEMSDLTVMIYLNDDYEGGTTDFCFRSGTIYGDPTDLTVKPEKGMVLVFTHNVLHRGAPVTSGKKYIMRSDVMYRLGD